MRPARVRLSLVGALVTALLAGPAAAQSLDGFFLPQTEREVFRDCETCPEMVRLESGIAVSSTPVTRREFGRFIDSFNYPQTGWGCWWKEPEIPQEEDHPVVCVSYDDARAYADWLSRTTGRTYRLPTLDEMSYAIMAGEISNYWWGQDVGDNRANCLGCGSPYDGKGTAPVGSFGANRLGVKDPVGNVWIWTSDCEVEVADGTCAERVLIGGSWFSPPGDLRAGRTIWNEANRRFDTYGMRVVRDVED